MLPRAASVPAHGWGAVCRGGVSRDAAGFTLSAQVAVPTCVTLSMWLHPPWNGTCVCNSTVAHQRMLLKHCGSEMLKNPNQTHQKNPQVDAYPSLLPLPMLPAPRQSQAGAVWEGIFALMPSAAGWAIRRRCAWISTGYSAMLLFLWQLFFIQQEEFQICRAKSSPRQKHLQFFKGLFNRCSL